jgi:hypothetical protein
MVQCIEELGTELKAALFCRPAEQYSLRERESQIRLSGTVHDPGRAVAKRGSNSIRADNWRTGKTSGIEIAAQF